MTDTVKKLTKIGRMNNLKELKEALIRAKETYKQQEGIEPFITVGNGTGVKFYQLAEMHEDILPRYYEMLKTMQPWSAMEILIKEKENE